MSASTPEPRAAPARPRRRWRLGPTIAVGYALLLAASWAVRAGRGGEAPAAGADGHAVSVSAVRGGERLADRPVRLAWHEWGSEGVEGEGPRPVVVLIHGSPGQGGDFARLGPLLAAHHRVIAPDLPGFGDSSRDVPDYSIEAHAVYVEDLLDRLGVGEAHLVGFSLGGGVVLHLADRRPRQTRSAVLLSSVGLQEYELLGNYHLNHALHALQLGFVELVDKAVPTFGRLDLDLAHSYARNFYDSDQRPLRGLLERLAPPTLIVHGRADVLVPVEAAEEHHRLVPQSELVLTDENHFMVFLSPGELVAPLLSFFDRVERGEVPDRAGADPERRRAAGEERATLPRLHGLALVIWMVLLAVATLVSEDLTCIAAGLLAARGRVDFAAAALACGIGIFLGDLGLYALGRLGRPWFHRAPLRWILRPEDVERASRWFERRGGLVVFLSRFLPGTRLPTYVAAGVLRVPLLRFAVQLFVPVALWTPLLVGLAWLFGDRLVASFDVFQRAALPAFLGFLGAVWLVLGLGRSLLTHRGRRLLVGWWKRKVQWEYWPLWLFYLPVLAKVAALALRHRSLTVFTAANPGIPNGGGFVGESKTEILARLGPEHVARFAPLPAGERPALRRGRVERFMAEHGFDLPVVVKTDRGQRGDDVVIARTWEDVDDAVRRVGGDALVQEYVPGYELGIFWLRHPDAERGRIFAITDKRLPVLVGDGERTLERLILDDARAVAQAQVHLRRHTLDLDRVPAAGEEVRLVELGTHCRGALFLDGRDLLTPALEEAVEKISRSYAGFYFGRYDVRAPSREAFARGEGLKVLELNGVTSEATSIYDPRHRLVDAYRTLFEQWRLAFEIGARNRAAGVRPATVGELLRMLAAARAGRRYEPAS